MPKQRTKKQRSRTNIDPLIKKPSALHGEDDTDGIGLGIKFRQIPAEKFTSEKPDLGSSSQLVEPKVTWKILKQAQEQQNEEGITKDNYEKNFPKLDLGSGDVDENDDDDNDDYEDLNDDNEEVIIDANDEAALAAFTEGSGTRRTLADMIMEKINEKKGEVNQILGEEELGANLPPQLQEHYSSIGRALAQYRSGKLPKSFKLIPRLSNWEDILDVMEPQNWSAAAMFAATRMFASNMSEGLVQRFYNIYLLPRIRDDIEYYKKLNFHMMQCLRKALFKPAAFFRGILLPLCQESAGGACTLREATIICTCLRENSVPPIHAAAGMLKIAEMEYNGVNSLILRTLIEKKYALPFRVLDALVFHFLKFRQEKRLLPVLWHQSFLSFVGIYGPDISEEQKEALCDLLKYQNHEKITPEIRRQIQRTEPRDDEMDAPPQHIMDEMMNA